MIPQAIALRVFHILVPLLALLGLGACELNAAPAQPRATKDALYMELIGQSDKGQLARVLRMLDSGVPVNVRFDDAEHDTPLTHAAGFGHLDVVRLLLSRRAQVNARTDDGKTALWNAAEAPLSESGEMTQSGPLPPTTAQRTAWTAAYVGIIRELLAHGANPNTPDRNGVTPLGIAAYRNRAAQVGALLQGGADPNQHDRWGKTPLDWAAYNENTAIVRVLQAQGARTGKVYRLPHPRQRTLDGKLREAVSRHDVAGVRAALAQGADVNALVNIYSQSHPPLMDLDTPLLAAVQSPLLTRLLLRAGANPNVADDRGETPLMNASAQVAPLLLARGAQVNSRDHDGQTPLMKSARDPVKVHLLLGHSAAVDVRDKNGRTALMNCHNETALRLLLAHGANINDADKAGQTALMNAAEQSYGEGGVTCDPAWARVLLRHGADPNRRNRDGKTAMMILTTPFNEPASDADYYDNNARRAFARLLLWRGARRDLRDRKGRTALQLALHSKAFRLGSLLRAHRRLPPITRSNAVVGANR